MLVNAKLKKFYCVKRNRFGAVVVLALLSFLKLLKVCGPDQHWIFSILSGIVAFNKIQHGLRAGV